MIKKHLFFAIYVLFFATYAQADTIRMMQYNLMYYTNNSGISDCNSSTNNLDNKDVNLKTIFQYVEPDVICVNEIGSNIQYVDRIMNNVLNINGINYFQHCPLTNYSGGYIANMLFYDSRKLSFHSHFYVTTSYRDINAYKMYYNSNDLSSGDTVFITFIIAHLKAGSTSTNEEQRYVQVQRLMGKLSQIGVADNYVFSGDFNFYSAFEDAYQHLIHYSNSLFQFYDPIDQEGDWNNNGAYSSIHTQSTHSSSSSGCFATGGMDDRFDIILVSPYLYYGSKRVQALSSSYHALGQDGNRFNGNIINPANEAIPSNVANALYNQSDHLPVILEFEVNATLNVSQQEIPYEIRVVNPIKDKLIIDIHSKEASNYLIDVYSTMGKKISSFNASLQSGANKIEFDFPFPPSLYLIQVKDEAQHCIVKKVVKNNY